MLSLDPHNGVLYVFRGRRGEGFIEVLEKIPARLKVIRHVRPKFSCRECETIIQALAPDLPIKRGRPGSGLIANVVVSKYLDGLPLYRQSAILARGDRDHGQNRRRTAKNSA